jgi:hypothetical protein
VVKETNQDAHEKSQARQGIVTKEKKDG